MGATAPQPMPPPEVPSLGGIYEAHFDHVWLTLRRLGVRQADIEDLAHDVFVVVHRRLDSYDPTRPLRPWLSGICYRVASDHRRLARHRREVPDAGRPEPGGREPDPERQAQALEARDEVLDALDALDPDQRLVLVMHDIDGFSAPEIAAGLDVPLNTCYSRLRLGRKRFAQAVRRARLLREAR